MKIEWEKMWEEISGPGMIDGWVGILGCSDLGWDYLFGPSDEGNPFLVLETPSNGAALPDGGTMPDLIDWSCPVKNRAHAERIIRAIEGE